MKNRDALFYMLILAVVIAFLISKIWFPYESTARIISTVTALISAVAFWLQFKRAERLNESSFVMNLNNQFISNANMTRIEHELELYYNQYEATRGKDTIIGRDKVEELILGLNLSRVNDDCQSLINYLVYLESLAVLVDRQVIHIGVIDDLFSYRFFLAVNNPVVQECELLPYHEYYKGVFRLSEYWIKNHRKKGIPIPMEEYGLSQKRLEDWKNGKRLIQLDISFARGSDKKLQIADCLYGTDKYIYPEAFGENKEQAIHAIRRLIGMDNSLFDYKNFFVARYNGQVCGICLVSDGNATWNKEACIKRIGKQYLPDNIVEGFSHASDDYFSHYCNGDLGEDAIEIVAFSVHEGFRRKGIASRLLDEVIEEYKNKKIQLTVLASNDIAISLYSSKGFVKIGEPTEGFAPLGLQKPMVYKMELQRYN